MPDVDAVPEGEFSWRQLNAQWHQLADAMLEPQVGERVLTQMARQFFGAHDGINPPPRLELPLTRLVPTTIGRTGST